MTTDKTWAMDPFLEDLKDSDLETYLGYLNSLANDFDLANLILAYNFIPKQILENIATNHPEHRINVLKHPSCPRELVTWAMHENSDELINALITSPITLSGEDLSHIWEKSEISQRVAIAGRKDCPTEILMDTWNSDFSQDSLFENNRELAFRNIASNPNIPKKLIVEFMKYPLDAVLDGQLTLGQLLLQNTSVEDETRALLVLRGVEKPVQVQEENVQGQIYVWPSNLAYRSRKVEQKYRDLFSSKAHPSSILDTRENLASTPYDADVVLQYWRIEDERIYKCLWPDLTNNPKVNFFFRNSSWQGDRVYVGISGDLDLTDGDFNNRVSGSQNWIIPSTTLSFDDVIEEISNRGFNEILESEPTEEIITSAAISEGLSTGLFSLTEKGKSYIEDAGNDWFGDADDVTFAAEVKPDPSQIVWSEIDQKRQEVIIEMVETALADVNAQNYKFAAYIGSLIALNPSISTEIRAKLESLPSTLIKQALHV
jgi:hypothetical protein